MVYKKLFWGFIFLFDFRIAGIDIMPDMIGFILFFQGLTMLEERNGYFGKAKRFAFPMIFISILDIYQVTVPINQLGNISIGVFGILFGLITAIISMVMVYNICFGIIDEARLINDFDLESKALSRWKLYVISNVLIMVGMVLPSLLGMLFIVVLVFSIVSYVLMLGLMNAASYKLE